jgi:RHS repeat-associated protein
MPGRKFTQANSSYRYGFNGKENDNEVKGEGNQQDYGMRIYDPRLVRFLSVDPIGKSYPMLTPYQFASNSPIAGVDLDGLEFYYAANGKFLAQGGDKNNTEVRLARSGGKTKSGSDIFVAVDKSGKDASLWTIVHTNHTTFLQVSSVIAQETSGNSATEALYISHTLNNKAKELGKTLEQTLAKESSVGVSSGSQSTTFDQNNNSKKVLNSRAGLIDVLVGNSDPTGGATQWDGNDFLAWGLTNGPYSDGSHAKFREYGRIEINGDILMSFKGEIGKTHPSGKISWNSLGVKNIPIMADVFKQNLDMEEGVFDYKTKSKSKNTLTATTTAGESIFWKVTKDKK